MGIQVKVIADSISDKGIRLTTVQLTYHRFILPEVLTHRMFSRNAASNRAINMQKMIDRVRSEPAVPVKWGRDQPGMMAKAEIREKEQAKNHWLYASDMATRYAEVLAKLKVHKQITNRVTIPYQHVDMIITATEWSNFFELRTAEDPQPEMIELATKLKNAMDSSEPRKLDEGQWHLPYIPDYDDQGNPSYYDYEDGLRITAKLSMGPCARVSYANHDNTMPEVEKELAFAERLIKSKHWSPAEHQATPMSDATVLTSKGVTHQDRNGQLWSANFRGWIQHRQILEQEND